jgi:hypothetical protein
MRVVAAIACTHAHNTHIWNEHCGMFGGFRRRIYFLSFFFPLDSSLFTSGLRRNGDGVSFAFFGLDGAVRCEWGDVTILFF